MDFVSKADFVLHRLSELLTYPPRDRMPSLLLFGATGIGKTKILRKFLRDNPSRFDRRTGVTVAPAVTMQMPPEPDEKSFYEELLGALQAPVKQGHTVGTLRRLARDLLGLMGARLLSFLLADTSAVHGRPGRTGGGRPVAACVRCQ